MWIGWCLNGGRVQGAPPSVPCLLGSCTGVEGRVSRALVFETRVCLGGVFADRQEKGHCASPDVRRDVLFGPKGVTVRVALRRRRAACSVCGQICRRVHDRAWRRWRHLDVGGQRCFVEYELRRVRWSASTPSMWCSSRGARSTRSAAPSGTPTARGRPAKFGCSRIAALASTAPSRSSHSSTCAAPASHPASRCDDFHTNDRSATKVEMIGARL